MCAWAQPGTETMPTLFGRTFSGGRMMASSGQQQQEHWVMSSSSSTQTSLSGAQSFMASWQTLTQQFSRTEAVVQQQASSSSSSSNFAAYQSLQSLTNAFQSTLALYNACSLCRSSSVLAQSGFQTEFAQSVRQMYQSFQAIMTAGQGRVYDDGGRRREDGSALDGMRGFGSFCQQLSAALKVDLARLLAGLRLNPALFARFGIRLSLAADPSTPRLLLPADPQTQDRAGLL